MKLYFLNRLYYAITDFRLYPYVVQKEKIKTAFGYFFKFILLISIILSISSTIKITNWLNEFSKDYNKQISEFEISNGELNLAEKINKDFLRVKIYADDSKIVSEKNIEELDLDNYRFSIVAFKDAVAFGSNRYGYVSFNYNESNININKNDLYSIINNSISSISARLTFILTLFIGLFAGLFITRFVYVLFISVMLIFLGLLFKVRYNFSDYLKVAFYIITLPTIIEMIAIMTVGELNDYTTITYYLLTYVYMFYAVRALKLDNILIETQEKILNMKSESEKANSVLENEKNKNDENEKKSDEDSDDKKSGL